VSGQLVTVLDFDETSARLHVPCPLPFGSAAIIEYRTLDGTFSFRGDLLAECQFARLVFDGPVIQA
jgi:hypothetical protein